MAVAYFMVSFTGKAIGHASAAIERFFPILNNKGELAVVFCFVLFLVVCYDPGRWSIDTILSRTAS